MPGFKFDVFLSHSSRDKRVVRSLAEQLRTAGLSVWFDEWSIPFGADIFQAIEKGLNDSRLCVLCMSRSAFDADWVNLEHNTRLFRDPANRSLRFFPVLIEDCAIPDTLARFKYFDYRLPTNDALGLLVAALRGEPPSTGELAIHAGPSAQVSPNLVASVIGNLDLDGIRLLANSVIDQGSKATKAANLEGNCDLGGTMRLQFGLNWSAINQPGFILSLRGTLDILVAHERGILTKQRQQSLGTMPAIDWDGLIEDQRKSLLQSRKELESKLAYFLTWISAQTYG